MSMLKKLKDEVYSANIDLVKHGLVIHTWGNVSGRDRESGLVVIKPSGVSYEMMKPSDMVVIDSSGKVLDGKFKPSTDAPTHLYLYSQFPMVSGIAHTHSAYASSWAQAGRSIPAFGTTHADHFYGPVPCTRKLSKEETDTDYELNTGKVIIEAFKEIDPGAVPSVIVNCHGPFSWGNSPAEAVYNAVALEEIARMAFYTILLGKSEPVDQYLLDKHYSRKHGKDAYYGQGNRK